MEKNTKLIIGLGLGAVALYLIFKPKGSAASNVNQAALTKCEWEYSRMARPRVMESQEYWKKEKDEFMKNCVQEYVASTTCKEGEELVDDLYPSYCTKDSINAGLCVQIPIKTCKPISKPNNNKGLDMFMGGDYHQPQNTCKEGEEMACGIAGCRCVPKIDKNPLFVLPNDVVIFS